MSMRDKIIAAGLRLWARGIDPTLSATATEAGISRQHISYYFNSGYRLREALAYEAVRSGNSRVIVQLIGYGHAAVSSMGDLERLSHLKAC